MYACCHSLSCASFVQQEPRRSSLSHQRVFGASVSFERYRRCLHPSNYTASSTRSERSLVIRRSLVVRLKTTLLDAEIVQQIHWVNFTRPEAVAARQAVLNGCVNGDGTAMPPLTDRLQTLVEGNVTVHAELWCSLAVASILVQFATGREPCHDLEQVLAWPFNASRPLSN